MRRFVLWICFPALLAVLGHAAAAATLYGPSGLILNPTAEVARARSVGVGATTFKTTKKGKEKTWIAGAAAVGLDGRSELGFTYLHRSNSTTESGAGGFAKLQLIRETPASPAFAIGADFVGGDLKTQQAFVVATKRISAPGNLHPLSASAGVIYAWDRDGVSRDDADIFAGASLGLSSGLSVLADWRSKTKGNIKDASGVALMVSSRFYSIAAGILNNGNSENYEFFIGAGFNVSTVD